MDITIKRKPLAGKLRAITSKSSMHRLLIAAALSDSETEIIFTDTNDDIEATIGVLEAFGSEIIRNTDSLTVKPISIKRTEPEIYCNQSASTARFLIPVAAVVSDNCKVLADEQLEKRPLTPLLDQMRKKGVEIAEEKLPLQLNGKLQSGKYSLPGNISSQYISGLLFALPLLDGDSEIIVTTEVESVAYIDMTIDVLTLFGIEIEREARRFLVKGGQKYISPKMIIADTDWSNSAFWLVAAAMGNELGMSNLNINSLQGDKEIIDILSDFGAKPMTCDDEISFSGEMNKQLIIDAKNIPDLVPILSVAASKVKGKTIIQNISRLRIKESDRVLSVINMINDLGGDAREEGDSIVIIGSGELRGGIVNSGGDHRIAMAGAIAACISREEVVIMGSEAVNKSYPNFFKHYERLGGKIYVK